MDSYPGEFAKKRPEPQTEVVSISSGSKNHDNVPLTRLYYFEDKYETCRPIRVI